MYNEFDSGVR